MGGALRFAMPMFRPAAVIAVFVVPVMPVFLGLPVTRFVL